MFKHLDKKQRYQIYALLKAGNTKKVIARILNVHPSTICRELKRNSGKKGYRPRQANNKAKIRKSEASKRNVYHCPEFLKPLVLQQIKNHAWSPMQVSQSLKRGTFQGGLTANISHETIYKWILEEQKAGGDTWKKLRRRQKKYNKRLNKTAGRGFIPNRVDIDERPAEVMTRKEWGHWEADTVIGTQAKGEVLVTLVERTSRMLLVGKAISKSATHVTKTLLALLKPYKNTVKSITFDNGKEFANHQVIAKELSCSCYFAKPYHSWERGSNERTNGLIRQYIPKGTPIHLFDDQQVRFVMNEINYRPMALHNYRCPAIVFQELINNSSGL